MAKLHDQLHRIRFLTLSLFVSGSFNLLLLALLCYWAMLDKPVVTIVPVKQASAAIINEEWLRHYRCLPFETLVAKLQQPNERDLALTALVAYYDFDIKRALCSSMHPLKSQMLICRNGEKLLTFPLLKEEQVQLILDFAKKERWPLKAKGLFSLLKQEKYKVDNSLREAFSLTDEFSLLKRFLPVEVLLAIVLEGSWDFFVKVSKEVESRQQFLLTYIQNGSPAAVSCLCKTEQEFVVNNLSEDGITLLFKLLKDQEEVKTLSSAISGKKKSANPYIVKEGDSLWKIARKYQIEIDRIKQFNSLSSDVLRPGTILHLPI